MGAIRGKIQESYGGLPKSIYILFAARVINRMGGFVHAFLALFLQKRMGMSDFEIANYIMVIGILTALSPFIGGKIADKQGRKGVYVVAQSMAALLLIPCGFLARSQPEIIPILLIISSAISSIIRPINSAMVADLTNSPDERRRAFALLYLGINVGVAVGPFIGGMLFENYIEIFFIGDAVTTLIAAGLVAFYVKETKLTQQEMESVQGGEKMEKGFVLFVLLRKPVILLFSFFTIFNSIVYAQSNFGLPLYLGKIFEDGAEKFGILMSFNAIIVLICTVPLTEILRKNRPIYNVAIASFLYIIGFGMMAVIGNVFVLFFVSVFLWTIGEILAVTHHTVFIMAHTPVNYRGRFNAIISFLMGVGHVFSPKIMSFFTEHFNYQVGWLVIGAIAFIAMVGFYMTGKLDEKLHPDIINSSVESLKEVEPT